MFSSIGIGELAVICIVLIIAVGPDRLPQMMKTVGKTMRTLRNASRDIRAQTGIDELMRDDAWDVRPPVRRPMPAPGPAINRSKVIPDPAELEAQIGAPALPSATSTIGTGPAAVLSTSATPLESPGQAAQNAAPSAPSLTETLDTDPNRKS